MTLVATLRHTLLLNDSIVTIFCTDTAHDTVLPLAYTTIHGCDSLRPLLLAHRNPLPPPAIMLSNAVDTFATGHPLVDCSVMPFNAVDTSRVSTWRWTVGDSLLMQGESRSGATAEWSLGVGRWALALVRTDSLGCADSLAATTEYGIPVTAVVAKDNVFGCQFHPEKSGKVGQAILRAFAEGVTV